MYLHPSSKFKNLQYDTYLSVLIFCLLFFVRTEHCSLIWRCHHCRVVKFKAMLDSHDLCSRKDLYRAIPADTDLGFNGLIRGTDSFGGSLRQAWESIWKRTSLATTIIIEYPERESFCCDLKISLCSLFRNKLWNR